MFKYFFIPLILSLFAGIMYLITASPAMLWVDAGNMIDAAVTFGVNVPPSPLYVLIAHFFTLLPFGSAIFRLQIFSALLASSSLFLLYRLIVWITEWTIKDQKLQPDQKSIVFAGTFGLLTLAFSYEFWSQAQNTDRFMFTVFMELLVLCLLTIYASHKKFTSVLFIVIFLCGLALGIDPSVVSFFPAVLFVLWQKRYLLTIKKLFLLGSIGLLGFLLVLIYLPLASIHNPFLNYERPTTIGRIWEIMTGQGQNNYNPITGAQNGFTGSFTVFLSSSWHFLTMLWLSFTPVLFPFVLIGGGYLLKIRKDLFWIFVSIVITNFLLSVVYLSGNQESWYLLSDTIFALFAGIGYFWILKKLHLRWYLLLLILVSLSPLVIWWNTLDRHSWKITDDYRHNLYRSITGPAILYGSADLFADTTYYTHDVAKDEPGVVPIIDNAFDILETYRQNVALTTDLNIPDDTRLNSIQTPQIYSNYVNDFFAMNMPKYKVYITYPALSSTFFNGFDTPSFTLDTSRFKLVPEGMVEEVVPKNAPVKPDLSDFSYQFSNGFPAHKPFMLENTYTDQLSVMIDEYASSYNSLGDYYEKNKNSTNALQYYQKAYAFDAKNADTLNKLGLYYGSNNSYKQAQSYFLKEEAIIPKDPQIAYNIGVTYLKSGYKNNAKSWFTKALSLANDNPQISEEVSNALTHLDTKNTKNTPNTAKNNTSNNSVNTWQTFKNTQMNVTFTYPPKYAIQSLGTNFVGLFASGQNTPVITLYSGEIASNTDLDSYAKTFPYAVQGTFIASKNTPIDGFDQAESYEYQTGTNETELVLMKKGNQAIALTIPLTRLNDQTFGNMLSQIVQSINLLH